MTHRTVVVSSAVILFLTAGVLAGLALYSTFTATAKVTELPRAARYLPAASQAVFGMNVRKFIDSPAYGRFEQRRGAEFGADLQEFILKTGLDPRRDIDYVVAASQRDGTRGQGVAIAQGRFNEGAITSFLHAKAVPIKIEYRNATVLMMPEAEGDRVEKGIAFLSDSEIALGDLDSLKAVLDARDDAAAGIEGNPAIAPLLDGMNAGEMFWFAGDASKILARAPRNTPLGGSVTAIQNVVGTLNLGDAVNGTIVLTAKDELSAGKLADVVKGFISLASLAGDRNPELVDLVKGLTVTQEQNKIRLVLNFPMDLLDKLDRGTAPFRRAG